MIGWIVDGLYHNSVMSCIFHTSIYCLKREINKGCHFVLDLGCGPDSPIKYCNVHYSVGIDAFEPYIKTSRDKKIHDEYILANISELNFKPHSFDAVILIEVLEHLTKEEGEDILNKVENWARKKVIVSTPNGYLSQGSMSHNPYQIHRSG